MLQRRDGQHVAGALSDPKACSSIRKNAQRHPRRHDLRRAGYRHQPARKVGNLSVSQMQMIEIAKAFSYDAKVVIMG